MILSDLCNDTLYNIFTYLDLESIACLNTVNKLLNQLTSQILIDSANYINCRKRLCVECKGNIDYSQKYYLLICRCQFDVYPRTHVDCVNKYKYFRKLIKYIYLKCPLCKNPTRGYLSKNWIKNSE